MFSKKILILLVLWAALSTLSLAQERITADELVGLALKESPLRKAAALQTLRQQTLVRKSTAWPDPELIIESPTGDFYVAGAEQTFEFPSVYTRQKDLARQQVLMAENEGQTIDRQVRLHVREHYLQWQYAVGRYELYQTRDSLFHQIKVLSDRQFDAGEIDAVQKTLAALKYAEAHTALLQAAAEIVVVKTRLEPFSSDLKNKIPVPLQDESVLANAIGLTQTDSSLLSQNWMLNTYKLGEAMADKEIQLEKARRMPDFRVGYLNQGMRNNPFVMGLRLGISIPLHTGGYTSSIRAAELELDRQKALQDQARQDIRAEWHQSRETLLQYRQTLEFLETNGLATADELAQSARRMYEAGQYDLVRLLALITESFALREMYLEHLMQYHRIAIQLHYIQGTL